MYALTFLIKFLSLKKTPPKMITMRVSFSSFTQNTNHSKISLNLAIYSINNYTLAGPMVHGHLGGIHDTTYIDYTPNSHSWVGLARSLVSYLGLGWKS